METTIANDYDPDDDMPASADPMTEYLTYLAQLGDVERCCALGCSSLRMFFELSKANPSRTHWESQ